MKTLGSLFLSRKQSKTKHITVHGETDAYIVSEGNYTHSAERNMWMTVLEACLRYDQKEMQTCEAIRTHTRKSLIGIQSAWIEKGKDEKN